MLVAASLGQQPLPPLNLTRIISGVRQCANQHPHRRIGGNVDIDNEHQDTYEVRVDYKTCLLGCGISRSGYRVASTRLDQIGSFQEIAIAAGIDHRDRDVQWLQYVQSKHDNELLPWGKCVAEADKWRRFTATPIRP